MNTCVPFWSKALGEERASSLLEDILETRDTTSGIETLNFMEPQSAADLIRDEHPQIIATILVHLKRGQAADILALFDERLRHDVMLRIATFGGVQPAALAELTEVLNGLLDGQNLKRSKMGGVRTAGGNHQPDENTAGRSGYYRRTRIRR
ncbi:flagellar motor switch protein FliG [Salmonella bongori]|nr:flagellar motor switch protein FliG [Salmonella bongori]